MNQVEDWLGIKQDKIAGILIDLGFRIALAIAILVIGFWIAKAMGRAV